MLGGNNIHVSLNSPKDCRDHCRIRDFVARLVCCRYGPDDKSDAVAIRDIKTEKTIEAYQELHESCGMISESFNHPYLVLWYCDLDLSMLQACSQVFAGKALLPFVANNPDALIGFIQRLVPEQQRALRCATFHSLWSGYLLSYLTKLTGLRDIVVFFDICKYMVERLRNEATGTLNERTMA